MLVRNLANRSGGWWERGGLQERPPAGVLRIFVDPLDLNVAMRPFNDGVIARPDLPINDEKPLPADVPPEEERAY
jgi:hypothetical protein